MKFESISIVRLMLAVLALGLCPGLANAASQVRISGLTDVAFGTLANFTPDTTKSQNICIYSSVSTHRYSVTATGSGTGGAFTLAAGTSTLAYEVQWAASSGQTTGSALTAGTPLTGQVANTTSSSCLTNTTPTASLITILRASAAGSATAGSYSGTLTLLIAPN